MSSDRMISIFENSAVSVRTHAFLDGVELVSCCVAADPIEGWADCYEKDEAGNLLFDDQRQPIIRRRFGAVRLEAVE